MFRVSLAASALLLFGLLVMTTSADEPAPEKKQQPVGETVKIITRVEFSYEKSNPPNLIITASGEVPTGGYTNVKLVQHEYVDPPQDGIQDFTLTAVPPDGPAIQVISTVTTSAKINAFTNIPWLKGVRIHGVKDGVVEEKLP